MMEIFPAIDLRNGQAVRLKQGDYDQMTVYSSSPADVAAEFKAQGARNLHVVDLDGAKDGTLSNFDTICEIIKTGGLSVQVGGGIRDEQRIQKYLDLGVERVILGTSALDRAFLTKMLVKFGSHIAVGVDAKDGKIAIKGWREVCDVDSVQFCRELAGIGVQTIIYTDIAKDGAMGGTNMAIYRQLAKEVSCRIIASGGVSFEHEIPQLAALGTYGAIIGKAVYTGAISLARAIALADGNQEVQV
ncbi:1-(5-phosphoribosyl)-5-[(5-phosphoribosylamino)methylideneamino]imidazole-4-carboxamide isomerase [Hydrogenoanaerobacterium sp.]|uniref:1-(5-phosphoribosyl)-5-[(5- phosphoribosylamino)methylideneamino]imidazole-4- carboxamide isomerase n=1 Tax=Hydrogenoanaerobacterium sp. TaxID=2953763 RepID=UPI0037C03855